MENRGIMSCTPDRVRRNGEDNMFVAVNKIARLARKMREKHPEMLDSRAVTEACEKLYPIK